MNTKTIGLVVLLMSVGMTVAAAQTQIDPNSLINVGSGEFTVDGALIVDAKAARDLHEAGTLFVDTRGASHFRLGYIPDAVLLDVGSDMAPDNLARHAEMDQLVVFYCEYPRCYKSASASAMAVAW